MTQILPRAFGSYELEEMFSRGGMAEIYRARRGGPHGFCKSLVLKKMLPGLARNGDFRRLFIEEAKTVALLDHPHIVPVYELGEIDGDLYMTMEYVDGFDLKTLLRKSLEKSAIMPLELAVDIGIRVASALDFAFRMNGPDGRPLRIVHRDVSPANILISFAGAVKLTDFGIAQAASSTRTSDPHPQGRLRYMSPEEAHGGPPDTRSDIFSLGVVLYEALAGRPDAPALDEIRRGEIAPLQSISSRVPPRLEEVVMRALAGSAPNRFADARGMLAALDRVLHDLGGAGSTQMAGFMERVFDTNSRKTRTGSTAP